MAEKEKEEGKVKSPAGIGEDSPLIIPSEEIESVTVSGGGNWDETKVKKIVDETNKAIKETGKEQAIRKDRLLQVYYGDTESSNLNSNLSRKLRKHFPNSKVKYGKVRTKSGKEFEGFIVYPPTST